MQEQHHETINWKLSFVLEDGRTLVTDKCILIDDRYVFVDQLPPEGRCGQYRRMQEYWATPFDERFGFSELTVRGDGHYIDPEGVVLNSKYISFLLQRIPEPELWFAKTGGIEDAVCIFRGADRIGLLMPFSSPPPFSAKLIAQAQGGCVSSQYFLGCYYRLGRDGAPKDLAEARTWFLAAARQDHAQANFQLGVMYIQGEGGPEDREKALEFIDRAVGLGFKEATSWRNGLRESLNAKGIRK
jgi:hypothetical protein